MLPSRLASLAVRHTRSDRSNSHTAPLATRKRRRFFVEWVIPPMSGELEIIAHRGASWDAPENSRAAVELAWRQGADAVEADFRLTRDGRIVAAHDDSLKRVTGVDLRVSEHSLDELRQLDIGGWKGPQWSGERIATLEEMLAVASPPAAPILRRDQERPGNRRRVGPSCSSERLAARANRADLFFGGGARRGSSSVAEIADVFGRRVSP